MSDKKLVIEMSGIDKHFRDFQVLNDIKFAIAEGEILGLLGPSGAGKTTIIKILTGQLRAERGIVRVMGREITGRSAVFQQFGVVLDNPGLYERLSCYDNLLIFAEIYGVSRSRIDKVLERVGLLEARKKPVSKLSKGMKQRLVLARAVLHHPKVLLLDEPTGALDPATAQQIHQLIEEQRAQGTAILLTTHNMEEAAKLCGHIALLHEGKIIEYGEPDEICRKYNHQNRVRILLRDGRQVELPNQPSAAEQIRTFFEGDSVESIHSSEPNLESVFMELTGKKLEG